jgi:4'-phosphopantetheinyl transferase
VNIHSDDPLRLDPDECHVWRVFLDTPPAVVARLRALLSADERARAARFVFESHRRRFVVAHGGLREILSGYVGVAPASLTFTSGPSGKPALVEPRTCLRFNLSHSGGLALVAVTLGREVGVDLEAHRPLPELDALAESCFSLVERRALAAVPEAQRLESFFDGWARKEAFLKLLGDGLARPLDSFDVTLTPGEPARLLRVAGDSTAAWTLHAVPVGPGHGGALAIEGPPVVIRLQDWAAGYATERNDGARRPGRHAGVRGGRQPRGAVFGLAGRRSAAEWLAGRRPERNEGRVPGLGPGGLDRHDAGEPAGGAKPPPDGSLNAGGRPTMGEAR